MNKKNFASVETYFYNKAKFLKLLQAEVFCSAQPQNIKDWRVKPCPGVRGAHNSSARGRGRATNRAECGDKCRAAVTKVYAFLSLFLLTSHFCATPYHPLSSVRGSTKDTTYLHSPSCPTLCVPSFLYLKTTYAHTYAHILNSTNTLIADCLVTYVINTKHTASSAKVIDAYIKAALP